MMESCIGAGLVNDKTDKSLFFALEPEAASLYCSINKEIDRKYFNKGEYYIVCDLGGGTGDIVAHLVGYNNSLNEINPSSGGNFGSNEIDKYIFKEIIFKLFGCQDFNTFYNKYKKYNVIEEKNEENEKGELFNDWCEFEREIKDFKEGITLKNIKDKIKYPINCALFKDIFENGTGINELVKEYNDTIYNDKLSLSVKVPRKWIVEFPYEIISEYMKNQADSICQIINKITLKEKIKTIIFVGGYCSNEVLVNLIKNNLKQIKSYLQPSNPGLAVMEGAVLFGIEPSIISIRKAKYTIGKEGAVPWDNKKHSGKGKKIFDESLNKWYCKNCFIKYVEINQDLKYEEIISHESFLIKGLQKVALRFYKTTKQNPVFAFEDGVIKIGECHLDVGAKYDKIEDRKIKIIIKFGGTFIDVTGIHLKSGNTVKTTLTFD